MSKEKRVYIIAVSVILVGSFTLSYHEIINMPDVHIIFKKQDKYDPNYVKNKGKTIEFVYIGSSQCPYCNVDKLPRLIDKAKVITKDFAKSNRYGFVSKAITTDRVSENGYSHIMSIGSFEEIIVGNGSNNMGLKKFYWGRMAGRPSTPQIIVGYKDISIPKDSISAGKLKYKDEKILARKYGIRSIERWVGNGAPLADIEK